MIQRQGEIYEEVLEELAAGLRELASAETPRAASAKQIERLEHSVSKAQANLSELSALAAKTATETLEIVNKRMGEAFDEAEGVLDKAKS
ncbi:MAG: hypothetical protein FJX56_09195 [Alphaproteobacteria bacterium]|nr:hypothetical protein [Alphaproteobacteria bacterium]